MPMLIQRAATAFREAGFAIKERVLFEEFSRPVNLVARNLHYSIGVVIREGVEVTQDVDLVDVIGAHAHALRHRIDVLWYLTEYPLSSQALLQVEKWRFLRVVQSAELEAKINELIILDPLAQNTVVAHPIWPVRAERSPRTAFVLMPFGTPWSTPVYDAIQTACALAQCKVSRADELSGTWIMHDIWFGIQKAAVIIADLTGRSPNVFYELGIAHTLGRPCILLAQEKPDVPFDVTGIRLLIYRWKNPADVTALVRQLAEQIGQLVT